MVTVVTDRGEQMVAGARVEGERLWLTPSDLEAATGWELQPEGFCHGGACVPLPAGRESELARDGRVEVGALWRQLGKALAHSETSDVWVLGEGAGDRAEALRSLQAPDFSLPDPSGAMHSLSEQRGKKVLLVSWASW
jgi:hypothetical protein